MFFSLNDFFNTFFFQCGHCKKLEPEWKETATKLKGEVKGGKVDATVEKTLGSRFQVQGYPTLKFFPAGKKDDSSAEKYEGGRDASTLVAWALETKAKSRPVMFEQLINQQIFDNSCKEFRGEFKRVYL